VTVSSTGQGEQQSTVAVAAPQAQPEADTFSVEFLTRDGCRLGISRYPDFAYNAQGGSGVGAGRGASGGGNDTVLVDFDVGSLYIPAMSGATTRFLGLPLPPFLKIEILPEALRGSIDRTTGQVTALHSLQPCVATNPALEISLGSSPVTRSSCLELAQPKKVITP
jgi:hypothetical protein